MDAPHTTYSEIDLGAIAANLRAVQAHTGVAVMPVIKANAYGHGAVAVGRFLQGLGVARLAVNRISEGVELRKAGITLPILVLGYGVELQAALEHDLTLAVGDIEVGRALANLGGARLHLKIDTGMGRFGALPQEALPLARELVALAGVQLEGVFTHFAVADSADPADQAYTRGQIEAFEGVLAALQGAGVRVPLRHAANSAGALYYPQARFDLVRLGISLYGLRPNAQHAAPISLQPALSLRSHVARLRTLPAGSSISYGRTYVTERPTPVALVPVGYGDGYHRALSGKGAVLVNGVRAPIVGRVCMDQFVVDVSACGVVRLNDPVVILGRQGGGQISAEEVAAWAGTINYEVTTALLNRAPRVYINP